MIHFYIFHPSPVSGSSSVWLDAFQLSLLNHRLVVNAEKKVVVSTSTSDFDYPAFTTLNGTHITLSESYEYWGIWLDSRLSFKIHTQHLTQKLKIKWGFLYRIKGCLSSSNYKTFVQSTFMSVLNYGDILYHHTSAVKPCVSLFMMLYH